MRGDDAPRSRGDEPLGAQQPPDAEFGFPALPAGTGPQGQSTQLRALVFGDFVGFSRLDGAGLKDFHALVLPTVGRCVREA